MRKILVVDDSRVTRELIKVFLIAKDVVLLDASDGFEALERARQERPDIVIADLRMPRLDGCELCRALQADPVTRSIPVLILTSSADGETVSQCRRAGAREVLRKPIQPKPLIEAVERHLGGGPQPM